MSDATPDNAIPTSAPAPGGRRSYVVVQVALVLGLLTLWFWTRRAQPETPEPLPIKGQVSAFELIDAAGEPVTLDSLRGDVWIADFIFSRCAGQCLDMTSRMGELHQALASDGNVRFVSITVDPTYDTPEVLANYARRQQAEADNWLFLTGPKDVVHHLVRNGFRLAAEEATPDQLLDGADMFLHSVKLVLVDGQGRIRGYYSSQEAGALHRLLADARRLARGPAS